MRNNLFSRLTIPQQAEVLLKKEFIWIPGKSRAFLWICIELYGLCILNLLHKKQEDFVVIKTYLFERKCRDYFHRE